MSPFTPLLLHRLLLLVALLPLLLVDLLNLLLVDLLPPPAGGSPPPLGDAATPPSPGGHAPPCQDHGAGPSQQFVRNETVDAVNNLMIRVSQNESDRAAMELGRVNRHAHQEIE